MQQGDIPAPAAASPRETRTGNVVPQDARPGGDLVGILTLRTSGRPP